MQRFIIHTKENRAQAVRAIQEIRSEPLMIVEIKPYKKDRSIAQNDLLYKWLTEFSKQSGNTVTWERGYYKYKFGVDILAETNSEIRPLVSALEAEYEYEKLINIMGSDLIGVTRHMKIKQMTTYLNHIEQDSITREIKLPCPEDLYLEAMA